MAGQSAGDRKEAAGQGLLQVLTRLTGLLSVPRNPAVVSAISNPESYYNAFDYVAAQDRGASNMVRVTFQRESILDLLEAAQLPVWWEERPSILFWVVLQQEGVRTLLTDTDSHELMAQLKANAQVRGLSVQFPVMDLQDALEISAADIWGRASSSIERASRRYEPGVIVVGRFNVVDQFGNASLSGHWEIWNQELPDVLQFSGEGLTDVASAGINDIAAHLIDGYAVLPRGARQTSVTIENVKTMADYADLMAYLGELTFLRGVELQNMQGERLVLGLNSQARSEQLEFLLTRQARLAASGRDLGAVDSELVLVWQG